MSGSVTHATRGAAQNDPTLVEASEERDPLHDELRQTETYAEGVALCQPSTGPDMVELTTAGGRVSELPTSVADHVVGLDLYQPTPLPSVSAPESIGEVSTTAMVIHPGGVAFEWNHCADTLNAAPDRQADLAEGELWHLETLTDSAADVWLAFEQDITGDPGQALICDDARRTDLSAAMTTSSAALGDELSAMTEVAALRRQVETVMAEFNAAVAMLDAEQADQDLAATTEELTMTEGELAALNAEASGFAGHILDVASKLVRGDVKGALQHVGGIALDHIRDEVLEPLLTDIIAGPERDRLQESVAILQAQQTELQSSRDAARLLAATETLRGAESAVTNLGETINDGLEVVDQRIDASGQAAGMVMEAAVVSGGTANESLMSFHDLELLREDVEGTGTMLTEDLARHRSWLESAALGRVGARLATGAAQHADAAGQAGVPGMVAARGYREVSRSAEAIAAWHDTELATVNEGLTELARYPGLQALRALSNEMYDRTRDLLSSCPGVDECSG